MKKLIKIIGIVFVIIILLGFIFCIVDYNKIKNGNKPIFCFKKIEYQDGGTNEYIGLGYKIIDFNTLLGYDEIKIGSWFMKYGDFDNEIASYEKYIEKEDYDKNTIEETIVKGDYPIKKALEDNCFIITIDKVYNKDILDKFIENTKYDAKDRIEDKIRIVVYNYDNYPTITDLEYKIFDKNTNKSGYIMVKDSTRLYYETEANENNRIIANQDIPGEYYGITIKEDPGLYVASIILKLYKNENEKIYEDIEIARYKID